jgi:hypothetical protein
MCVGRVAVIAVSSSAILSIMTACTSWIRSRFPSPESGRTILVLLLILFALQLTSCPLGCPSAVSLLRLFSGLRYAHVGQRRQQRSAGTQESVKPMLPFYSLWASSRLLKKGKETAAVAGTTCAIHWEDFPSGRALLKEACPSRCVLLAEKPAPQKAQARRKMCRSRRSSSSNAWVGRVLAEMPAFELGWRGRGGQRLGVPCTYTMLT